MDGHKAPNGLYQTDAGEGGAEFAWVDFGSGRHGGVPRVIYEQKGYQPYFYDLPTKEQYDAARDREALKGKAKVQA